MQSDPIRSRAMHSCMYHTPYTPPYTPVCTHTHTRAHARTHTSNLSNPDPPASLAHGWMDAVFAPFFDGARVHRSRPGQGLERPRTPIDRSIEISRSIHARDSTPAVEKVPQKAPKKRHLFPASIGASLRRARADQTTRRRRRRRCVASRRVGLFYI